MTTLMMINVPCSGVCALWMCVTGQSRRPVCTSGCFFFYHADVCEHVADSWALDCDAPGSPRVCFFQNVTELAFRQHSCCCLCLHGFYVAKHKKKKKKGGDKKQDPPPFLAFIPLLPLCFILQREMIGEEESQWTEWSDGEMVRWIVSEVERCVGRRCIKCHSEWWPAWESMSKLLRSCRAAADNAFSQITVLSLHPLSSFLLHLSFQLHLSCRTTDWPHLSPPGCFGDTALHL